MTTADLIARLYGRDGTTQEWMDPVTWEVYTIERMCIRCKGARLDAPHGAGVVYQFADGSCLVIRDDAWCAMVCEE